MIRRSFFMDEAEWKTRRDRIDKRLRFCNPPWQIIPYRAGLDCLQLTCHAVSEFPTDKGPADYGFFVEGQFLGILEAKKVTINPQNVLEQAKRYSAGAFNGPRNWNGYRVPFLFATNGEIIWFLDVRRDKAASRILRGFHTGPALEALFAFDVIIADECHRGYTAQEMSIWRETINHFDAIKIGLTATPAAHTTALFGPPVFRYTVEQAILDGYLVDYEPVAIKSEVRMNGVFLKDGETVERVDTDTGQKALDQLEDERAFEAADIERSITAPDSNRKIIEEVAKYAYEHEAETGRFPKTLIFAVNDMPHTSHADQLVKICRDVFKQGDDFVKKITGNPNVDRPLQRIREFRNRPNPKVVVTVDMLSTGVDIPALEFIVFLRPVKSRILWEQMLGRGTRRCDDINKSKFVIFDCFDGTLIRYFKNVSSFAIEPPRGTPLTIPEVIENTWQNVDHDYHVRILAKRLLRIDKDMNAEARTLFAAWIPDGDMGRFAKELPQKLNQDFAGTMKLLRNTDLQKLLLDYPRARRVFIETIEEKDVVTSQKLERYGKFDNAEDYLDAFERFVKTNADKVAALGVLLQHPEKWRPAAMEELKRTLSQNGFEPEKLQRAHRAKGFKALADVISIVKHAAIVQSPLLTAEERVNRAMDKFLAAHKLTPEQMQWLSLVREHLVKNLSMDEEDFDLTPLLGMRGGKAKARKVFGDIRKLVGELNEAVAA